MSLTLQRSPHGARRRSNSNYLNTQTLAGRAFYRAESAQARDLAILAAIVYRQREGQLRVLDLMCGCGGRAVRYLQQVRRSTFSHVTAAQH